MRILHYSLGFPPYRSGGLTKFCVDLMHQQIADGHQVSLLWPGEMFGTKPKIRQRKPVNGVTSYEMLNPLPISYDEGITKIKAFTRKGDKKVFEEFLQDLRPDIIHLHTFMGLYSSFIDAANEIKIRTVFTTHDFFPICPKVTMYRHGKICNQVNSFEACPQCNTTALSLNNICILQSALYRILKDMQIIKKMRKTHRDNYLNEKIEEDIKASGTVEDYKNLRAYYASMLEKLDCVHFNSSVTEKIYKKYFTIHEYKRIPITHSDIVDHRKRKVFSSEMLHIRYLGPQGGVKGFFLLKAALDELWKERQDFCLDIHFTPVEMSPYMRTHDRFGYSELEQIFAETDVLLVPSLWYETFGYTVLEALSFGVPVVISGTVGARDILVEGAGIVIEDISSEKLLDEIKKLTPETLDAMNRIILEKQYIVNIQEMADKIFKECYLGN